MVVKDLGVVAGIGKLRCKYFLCNSLKELHLIHINSLPEFHTLKSYP